MSRLPERFAAFVLAAFVFSAFVFSAFVFSAFVFSACALTSTFHGAPEDWKRETALVSRKGTETVVRHPESDTVIYANTDPQLAIEWGMKKCRSTIVLAGEYLVSDRIDIPRPGVTLIVDRGAVFRLNVDTKHTTIDFKSRNVGYWQMLPFIYNKGQDDVRVLMFGELVKWRRQGEKSGKQTIPMMFDGRNSKGDRGLSGGMMLVVGRATDTFWLVDVKNVEVPIIALDTGLDAVLAVEGSDDCKLGMIANLAREPGGNTGETVDLNSRSLDITIERLVGERSHEIIDCNESHVVVGEAVSVGVPRKTFGRGAASGPRYTDRKPFGSRSLDVRKTTILRDAKTARLIHEIPKLPDALPKFTVKTTVEVTHEDGRKTRYAKAVEIDLRR